MKVALLRGFSLLLSIALLGATGCGTDNESEAERLQKSVGTPSITDVKSGETSPPAKDMGEYARQQKERYSNPGQTEYGKAMKKK